jgi:hypothetical protein
MFPAFAPPALRPLACGQQLSGPSPLAQIHGPGDLDRLQRCGFRRKTWLARPVIPALARHPLAQIHGPGDLDRLQRCGFRRRTWLARLEFPAFAPPALRPLACGQQLSGPSPLAQIHGASDLAPRSAARFRRRTWLARLWFSGRQGPGPTASPCPPRLGLAGREIRAGWYGRELGNTAYRSSRATTARNLSRLTGLVRCSTKPAAWLCLRSEGWP